MSGPPEQPDLSPNFHHLPATRSAADDVPRNILVVDMDHALLGLLDEWLGAAGLRVVSDAEALNGESCSLVIVDLPNPRNASDGLLRAIGRDHPGVPVIALSSTFFPRIDRTGTVARALGVACALPKPVSRESLLGVVQSLLDR
jgi:DNA-binding response OmpR family regulator